MTEKIKAALLKLNPENDNHWTADGQPRIDTLRMMAGDPSITREAIVLADANFNRDSARAAQQATRTDQAPNVTPVAVAPVAPIKPVAAPLALAEKPKGPDAPKEPEKVVPVEDSDAELEQLQKLISDGQAYLDETAAKLSELRVKRDAMVTERDNDGQPDHVKTQMGIRAYLDSQAAQREEAAKLAATIVTKPSLKSELDRSLAARRR